MGLRLTVAACLLVLLALAPAAQAATFTVNGNGDGTDASTADGVCDSLAFTSGQQCTLRAAIEQSNFSAGTADLIAFDMAMPSIFVGSALPTVTDPVTIDGTTQPLGKVDLSGMNLAAASGISGLYVTAGSTTVRELIVRDFPLYGFRLATNGANKLEGNWVGIGSDGFTDRGNAGGGIVVEGGASNAIGGPGTIGSTGVPRGNVVSGNEGNQIQTSATLPPITIQGNRVGTNATGDNSVPGSGQGINLGGNGHQIGGTGAGEGNVISGGSSVGLLVQGGDSNTIQGNVVGLDAAGTADISTNTIRGVQLQADSLNNVIGGAAAGARNVISGNGVGLAIGEGSTGTLVRGNRIGTDVTGTLDRGNDSHGVTVGAGSNEIGGPGSGEGNVISGNGGIGVLFTASIASQPDDVQIRGNRIGTDAAGTAAIGNEGTGVNITEGTGALVSENTIGANGFGSPSVPQTGAGVVVTTASNSVGDNAVGTDFAGTAQLGNAGTGIQVGGSSNSVTGNAVAFNRRDGVFGTGGAGNSVLNNVISSNGSTAADLAIDLGNDGVTANDAAPDADTGPNNLQNFPVLTVAEQVGASSTRVEGTLTSAPNTTYRIDLYSNDEGCDDGGHGEAQTQFDFLNVTTDGSGQATVAYTPAASLPVGTALTAIATDPAGNTSELSACRTVTAGPELSIGDASVVEGAGDAGFAVTLSRTSSETVTVDYETEDGTAIQPGDYDGASGTVTFAPGDTSEPVSAGVNDDAIDEPDEIFEVSLSNPSSATIDDGTGVGTISDDDEPATVPDGDDGPGTTPEDDEPVKPAPDTTAPETTGGQGPLDPTNDPRPRFEFSSSEAGSRFECRVDGGTWAACGSPFAAGPLDNGRHVVEIRAIDAAGNTDQTPARFEFTVNLACLNPAGPVRGKQLGTARLGETRRALRGRLGGRTRRRVNVDRYCLAGGRTFRVGYPSPRLLRRLRPVDRGRLRERAGVLLSATPLQVLRGIRPGGPASELRGLRGFDILRLGRNRWHVSRRGRTRLLFKVRSGVVREVGIAVPRLMTRRFRASVLGSFK